jgi:membrane protein required for colicin V production
MGQAMHWIDVAVISVLAFCFLLGLARGFLFETIGLFALAIALSLSLAAVEAIFPTVRESDFVRGAVAAHGVADNFVKLAIYLLAFAVARVVPGVVGSAFGQQTTVSGIVGSSRLLGGAVGVVKGCVYVIAAYLLGGLIASPNHWPAGWQEARSVKAVEHAIAFGAPYLPPNMRPEIKSQQRRHAADLRGF